MYYSKLRRFVYSGAVVLTSITSPHVFGDASAWTSQLQGTATATPFVTAEAIPTAVATQDATAPLRFLSFVPTDIGFNPSIEKPGAIIIVFSLIFQNQLAENLHVQSPHFQLAIHGYGITTRSA